MTEVPTDERKVDGSGCLGLGLGLRLASGLGTGLGLRLGTGLVGEVRGGSGSLWVAWALCSLLFAIVVFML